MTLADRVVVMNHGVIEQVGTPQELYHRPKTKFVAGFIGSPAMNFIPVKLVRQGDGLGLHLGDGLSIVLPSEQAQHYQNLSRQRALIAGHSA